MVKTERLNHEIIESADYPGHWHVEAVSEDGQIAVAVFSGWNAKELAEEYFAWKRRQSGKGKLGVVLTMVRKKESE